MLISISRPSVPATKLFVKHMQSEQKEGYKQKPTVFILPGGPGADHTVYLSYTALEKVADLVFHDPRGCGESEKGDLSTYTMDNYIDDVEAIRKHLGVNKIVVLGKSYGSMCALGYALRYPLHTEKLILSAGAPSYRFIEQAKKNLAQYGTPAQIKACEKLWAGQFSSDEDLKNYFLITQSLYSVKAQHPDHAYFQKKKSQFSYEVLNEGFRNHFWYFDYEKVLPKIACPTLILAGKMDWINDVSLAELMKEKIPHSKLVVFEHASHAMEIDVTDEYFQTIEMFLRNG